MRRLTGALVLVTILLTTLISQAGPPLTPSQVVSNAAGYEKKVITVTGEVKEYLQGADWTFFQLTDGKRSCSVVQNAKAGLAEGQKVTVTGTFAGSLEHPVVGRIRNAVLATRIVKAPQR